MDYSIYYKNHTFQVESTPSFRVSFTNGTDTHYLEPFKTQIIKADGSQMIVEYGNIYLVNENSTTNQSSSFYDYTWINSNSSTNQTQWRDDFCTYTEVSFMNGTNMTRYAQCSNGTTFYYPGLNEPEILYKSTNYQ